MSWAFPGGSVVKNPPFNAGDIGLIPRRVTKTPHALGQLSWRAAVTEPRSEKSLHATTKIVHSQK